MKNRIRIKRSMAARATKIGQNEASAKWFGGEVGQAMIEGVDTYGQCRREINEKTMVEVSPESW
jgi:hypothetical protein